jgi:hypothetical protein
VASRRRFPRHATPVCAFPHPDGSAEGSSLDHGEVSGELSVKVCDATDELSCFVLLVLIYCFWLDPWYFLTVDPNDGGLVRIPSNS